MSSPVRVLAFSGSARKESWNRKLLAVAVEKLRAKGAQVNLVDLNQFEMPIFHGDLEEQTGMPPNATRLVELIRHHDALLIASPEYNSFPTPLLKNTIDWCTRADDDPFPGRVVAVISASPGNFGGISSLRHVRHLMLHLGCHVVPKFAVLPRAADAFDVNGGLKEARAAKALDGVVSGLIDLASRLKA